MTRAEEGLEKTLLAIETLHRIKELYHFNAPGLKNHLALDTLSDRTHSQT